MRANEFGCALLPMSDLLASADSETQNKSVGALSRGMPDPQEPDASVSDDASDEPADPNDNATSEEDPPPGHGRYGADDYPGADQVEVTHPTLRAGDDCPECHQGPLYEKRPGVLVRFVGRAPLHATVYRPPETRGRAEWQRRCALGLMRGSVGPR